MQTPKYGLFSFHSDFGRFEQHIGISEKLAISAATDPDSFETVEVEGRVFRHLFTKYITDDPHGASIIVYGDPLSDEELEIVRAFRIYPDLCENSRLLRPHELLYALANTFGCDITIGSVTQKFFFEQTVIIKDQGAPMARQADEPNMPDFIKIHWTESTNFTYEGASYPAEDDPNTINCLLVFSIDLDKYIGWVKLKEHSSN